MVPTDKPVPTDVVITKFFNGFLNGYIFSGRDNWSSNIEESDAELFDLDFLISVWRIGAAFGVASREGAKN